MTGPQERSLSLPRVASGVLARPQNRGKLDSCFMDKEMEGVGLCPGIVRSQEAWCPQGPVPDAAHLLQLLASDQPIRGGKDTATAEHLAFVEAAGKAVWPQGGSPCHRPLVAAAMRLTERPCSLPPPHPAPCLFHILGNTSPWTSVSLTATWTNTSMGLGPPAPGPQPTFCQAARPALEVTCA